MTDLIFTLGANFADAEVPEGAPPVWRYMLTEKAPGGLFKGTSAHAWDLPILFGTDAGLFGSDGKFTPYSEEVGCQGMHVMGQNLVGQFASEENHAKIQTMTDMVRSLWFQFARAGGSNGTEET